jgi:hypothetical protein
MDMPLTADLPGGRDSVRCYFVADARGDPYGKKKIPAGPHEKAFHLDPFWTAAQRQEDVLSLVIYRNKDVPTNAAGLESNFVMPLDADGFWVGRKRVTFERGKPQRVDIATGVPVAVRQGSAALGIKVPWTRRQGGSAAATALVYDGNDFGAVRLMADHAKERAARTAGSVNAGAAFWLRLGSALGGQAEFESWMESFAEAKADVRAETDRVEVKVRGEHGALTVSAAAPWSEPSVIEPTPSRAVLELNGADIGAAVLKKGP